VFWRLFIAAGMLAAGHVTTTLHCVFLVLQVAGAIAAGARAPEESARIASPV
jgi:hypothetical protein